MKKPRRKKKLCPCGVCRWCYRCKVWVDAERICLHLPLYRGK